MSMKITCRNARADKAGKHNDRNFNVDNAPHIDQARTKDNRYWTYNGDTSRKLVDLEEEFYREHFSKHLNEQNERYRQSKHGGRVRSIEQYCHATNSRPEDNLLQIGNIKEHASGEELWECAMAYREAFDSLYGDHCKILSMSLHLDEATPHVHVRRVWISQDERGHECVSQTRALADIGITSMSPDKVEGRFNNPKIAFSSMDRELFRQICIEKGIDVDFSPASGKQHLSTIEYKKQQIEEEIEELTREADRLRQETKTGQELSQAGEAASQAIENLLRSDPFSDGRYLAFLHDLDQREKVEKQRLLLLELKRILKHYEASRGSSYDEKARDAIAAARAEEIYRDALTFIEQQGLSQAFEAYQHDKKEETREQSRLKESGPVTPTRRFF